MGICLGFHLSVNVYMGGVNLQACTICNEPVECNSIMHAMLLPYSCKVEAWLMTIKLDLIFSVNHCMHE